MRPFIALGRVERDGPVLRVPLRASPPVRRYLRQETFWADYGPSAHLQQVPDSVLAVPAVGSVIALAWALGAEVRVPSLDRRFHEALDRVAAVLQGYYPFLKVGASALLAHDLVANVSPGSGRVGLLYSGGIDSNASLVERGEEITDLFTIWGADVATDNRAFWHTHLAPLVLENGPSRGKRAHFVRSNSRELPDEAELDRRFGPLLTAGSWWGALQHALSLLSLVAPITHREGIGRVLIASSFSEAYNRLWGSAPEIDEHIAWSTTTVSHHGYHWTRQEKIQHVLAPYARQGNRLLLAPCDRSTRGRGRLNCGLCITCIKAVAGLLVAGVDPNRCGFVLDEATVDRALEKFARREFRFGDGGVFLWRDVQRHIPEDLSNVPDVPGGRRLVAWLREFDFAAYSRGAMERREPRLHQAATSALAARLFKSLPWSVQDRIVRLPHARRIIET